MEPFIMSDTNSIYQSKTEISIKEARKLLGKEYRIFSDDQIADIISLLAAIARDFVEDTVPEK